jgi:MFS family permease
LALTVLAAASPGYWWFVVLFALGRPLLSATNALSQVSAAEQTSSHDRAKAVALVAAGYSLGAGLTAVIHSLAHSALGFRGLFALSVVPLALLWFVRGSVTEPDRFAVAEASTEHPLPVLGAVGPNFRRRLGIVALLGFAVAVITGPANTFIFLYAENVVHLSGALTAAMVVASGVVGLGGLVVGRWLADNVGRRPTAALGMVAVALSGVVAYSGSSGALVLGYIFGVVSGAVLAPALGALVNELFPTSIRASVAGWLVAAGVAGAVVGLLAFGAVADIRNRWGLAAVIVFLPAAAAAGLFWSVPETRGREPEQLWPDTA